MILKRTVARSKSRPKSKPNVGRSPTPKGKQPEVLRAHNQERDEHGRWKAGVSGNAHGRPPKGQSLSELLRKTTNKRSLVRRLRKMAEGGDMAAMRLLLSYSEGPPSATPVPIADAPQEWQEINSEKLAQLSVDRIGVVGFRLRTDGRCGRAACRWTLSHRQ